MGNPYTYSEAGIARFFLFIISLKQPSEVRTLNDPVFTSEETEDERA